MSTCRRIVTCELYDKNFDILVSAENIAHCNGQCTNPPGSTNGICHAEHAEIVALGKLKPTDEPYYTVISWPPCYNCYKTLLAAGVRIIYANF